MAFRIDEIYVHTMPLAVHSYLAVRVASHPFVPVYHKSLERVRAIHAIRKMGENMTLGRWRGFIAVSAPRRQGAVSVRLEPL